MNVPALGLLRFAMQALGAVHRCGELRSLQRNIVGDVGLARWVLRGGLSVRRNVARSKARSVHVAQDGLW